MTRGHKPPSGLKIYCSGSRWHVYHRLTNTPILRSLDERPTPDYLASAEFRKLYDAAKTGTPAHALPANQPGRKPSWSCAYAVDYYLASPKYASLSHFTRRNRGPMLRAFRDQFGDQDMTMLTRERIIKIIAAERLPSNQRKLRAALHDMCGVMSDGSTPDACRLETNPVVGIKTKALPQSEGWEQWTDQQCAKFEKRWPIGTQQRLAYEIMRWTALRIGDAVRLGPEHVREQTVAGKKITMISLVPKKTRSQPLSRMFCAMPPQLRKAIDATKVVGFSTFLVNYGQGKAKSWHSESQPTNWFREACTEARIRPAKGRGIGAHGLRKYRLVELLHKGWTYEKLMRLSGHTSRVTLEKYLRGADRERMALEQAATEWEAAS